jgi:hypothetical protein
MRIAPALPARTFAYSALPRPQALFLQRDAADDDRVTRGLTFDDETGIIGTPLETTALTPPKRGLTDSQEDDILYGCHPNGGGLERRDETDEFAA